MLGACKEGLVQRGCAGGASGLRRHVRRRARRRVRRHTRDGVRGMCMWCAQGNVPLLFAMPEHRTQIQSFMRADQWQMLN